VGSIDIRYPLPDPLAHLLLTLVEVAERNEILSVSFSLGQSTTEDREASDLMIQDPKKGDYLVVPGVRWNLLIGSLYMLGLAEQVGENSLFLYPGAFERARYERKNRLGKWWVRTMLRWRDALLVVTSIATLVLVILQIAEIVGWLK
jgi:hypothetical protein